MLCKKCLTIIFLKNVNDKYVDYCRKCHSEVDKSGNPTNEQN